MSLRPQQYLHLPLPDLIRDRDIAFSNLAAKSPKEVEGFEDIIGDCQPIRDAT